MRAGGKSRLGAALGGLADLFEVMVLTSFAVIFVFTFFIRLIRVEGVSMEDTLFRNDRLAVVRLFYEPSPGDIVIIDSTAKNEMLVKRVIAVGGQSVSINAQTGEVTVDGQVLYEDYVKAYHSYDTEDFDITYYNKDTDSFEYLIPEGQVFVMGDNRNRSSDSRMFGCISDEEIVGKAVFRVHSERSYTGVIR